MNLQEVEFEFDSTEVAETLKNAINGEEEDEIYDPIEDTEFLRGKTIVLMKLLTLSKFDYFLTNFL